MYSFSFINLNLALNASSRRRRSGLHGGSSCGMSQVSSASPIMISMKAMLEASRHYLSSAAPFAVCNTVAYTRLFGIFL